MWRGPNSTITSRRMASRYVSSFGTCKSNVDSDDPVIIVGGGPTGLFLSLLLDRYGVPSIVLEQQSVKQRFQHPQAHFLNTRTMEILKHYIPNVYRRVRSQMPCVSQWRYFRFGSNLKDPHAIVVRHPVDIPLQADVDANGVLNQDSKVSKRTRDLSPVSVGHLAQHTFGRILYEEASVKSCSTLLYDMEVTQIDTPPSGPIEVKTRDGTTLQGRLLIGADGAHSFVRRHMGIRMHGASEMQHLMNIHVRHNLAEAPPAMLYSTYTPTSVAMTVCHSPGEYIVQIPFFKPYQTPEEDFAPEKLSNILDDIFGEPIPTASIISSKPWTMGSLVAERYVSEKVVVIGDAAHVFPPAGGFGMNTGLQDAHNLAWKIAGRLDLGCYEKERRPVAQQNAALSVRNYERLLKVTQSAYLDKRHPDLLKYMLDFSPLPLSVRKRIFRSLYQAALFPFTWLSHPSGIYAKHIRSNLCSALQRGTGLPLLFPTNEIGFTYDNPTDCTTVQSSLSQWLQDTVPSQPKLVAGALVPHDIMNVVSPGSSMDGKEITMVDLPGQLDDSNPTYVLLYWKPHSYDSSFVDELLKHLRVKLGFSVRVVVGGDSAEDLSSVTQSPSVDRLLSCKDGFFSSEDSQIILIRPDGHIKGILVSPSSDSKPVPELAAALVGG